MFAVLLNTVPFWLIAGIGITHFVADFICQTDEMARGKSSSNFWLTLHVIVYTIMIGVGSTIMFANQKWGATFLIWPLLNGLLHWPTDYITSRWSKKYFSKQDYHNGFVVVGFDQLIHLLCLTGTAAWMIR